MVAIYTYRYRYMYVSIYVHEPHCFFMHLPSVEDCTLTFESSSKNFSLDRERLLSLQLFTSRTASLLFFITPVLTILFTTFIKAPLKVAPDISCYPGEKISSE